MSGKIRYRFTAEIWVYPGNVGWHFVSLPLELSKEIRDNLKSEEEGWGRMKAKAKIGNTEWDTSIWFDTKMGTYILPLKAEIRKKERLETGKEVEIIILI